MLKMTKPQDLEDINSSNVVLGEPMFRSWLLLFKVIPIDYSDLTLVELKQGEGFAEESKMGSMKLWRHERRIIPTANGCAIKDKLTFQPKFATKITAALIRILFEHRHKILRKILNTDA